MINYGTILPLPSSHTAYNPCTGYTTCHSPNSPIWCQVGVDARPASLPRARAIRRRGSRARFAAVVRASRRDKIRHCDGSGTTRDAAPSRHAGPTARWPSRRSERLFWARAIGRRGSWERFAAVPASRRDEMCHRGGSVIVRERLRQRPVLRLATPSRRTAGGTIRQVR